MIAPFEIYPGIVVPPGHVRRGHARHPVRDGQPSQGRSVSARFVDYPDGSFYGGSRFDQYLQLTWRPSARFRGSVGYEYRRHHLAGRRVLRAARARRASTWRSHSTLSLVNLVQYDNISEVAGMNVRLLWIPQAGREMYFVINHNLEDLDRDNRFQSQFSDVTAKINYTFRF